MNDQVRRQWCAAVAKLVYPLDPERCVKTLVGYLPMLRDLPDAAFSPASAEEVALHDRRMAFPSFLRSRSPSIQRATATIVGAALGTHDAVHAGDPLMAASKPADER